MASDNAEQLPAQLPELAKYISEHPEQSMIEIMEPYRRYEAFLRTAFAQDQQNPKLDDPYVNALPLFTGDTDRITVRARDLESESEEEKSRYIMPLPEEKRRPTGSPATVPSVEDFRYNFGIFSESSLAGLDWNNVVAAGSSVVNCLLPVPGAFNQSKRTLREYYHEKFCPASDVDLFLYGLTHDQAVEKIAQIEKAVKDALLCQVTVIRTKHAITIVSQYPVRHVQIVLRLYKSVSEILTGFDIDAAGGAYDGKQVYVTPRALASFITQVNHIDLTRRSPSYENRLSKYSHRNFEIYWPDLERSRIDPTIFERSFKRTLGLARLLVLERLPTTHARDAYLDKRRKERGRPAVRRAVDYHLGGNLKDSYEDEVADWLEADKELSSYTTFSLPYGQRWTAKRIEKLCYTQDLLLNAEWNQPDDRTVYLHRHPAFFGRVQDIVQDCCGSCPIPTTIEEIELAEKESKFYISGEVEFLVDDPGRQEIGSFNPLTEQDWTDMAYVGNTARLCQSIVDGNAEEVEDWLGQDGNDVNARDYTGRTPLHLAVISSTPAVVRCLVEHGARLIARVADGRTALHLAASRGDAEMIKILMDKSDENEEAEEEKKQKNLEKKGSEKDDDVDGSAEAEDDSDGVLVDGDESDTDIHSMTTGSFVKVKGHGEVDALNPELELPEDEPDFYTVDVVAWDVPCSPLHLAIAGGHEDAVKALCDYGADAILPVKFLGKANDEKVPILTLSLALSLPLGKAKSMAKLLLSLGAVSSQADMKGATAFHRFVKDGKRDLVGVLLENDHQGIKKAINYILFSETRWDTKAAAAPLHTAIRIGDPILVLKLLNAGADANITFESWLKSAKSSPTMSHRLGDLESNKKQFREIEQPVVHAILSGNFEAAAALLEAGADPNTLNKEGEEQIIPDNLSYIQRVKGKSILDLVDCYILSIKSYLQAMRRVPVYELKKPTLKDGLDEHLAEYKPGTYQHWVVSEKVKHHKDVYDGEMKHYEKSLEPPEMTVDVEKEALMEELREGFENLRETIVSKGGKPFLELHPQFIIKGEPDQPHPPPKVQQQAGTFVPKPFEYHFNFKKDTGITDWRVKAYIELMEAAWAGDLDRIKALTLKSWGPESDQTPLMVSVYDQDKNNPFSLAFLRGHYTVARAILEIAQAQWAPEQEKKLRYKMANDGSGSDTDMEDDESRPNIVAESADYQFVIDDIGDEPLEVRSNVNAEQMLGWTAWKFVMKEGNPESNGTGTLFQHCFEANDATGMGHLLDMARHWALHKFDDNHNDDEDDEDQKRPIFSFPLAEFQWAIENGRTELLSLVIEKTGAGVPLERLVQWSGFKTNKKPKFYQGLTVYGRKRKDWANAGRGGSYGTYTGMYSSPLRFAVEKACIESVEYFMSNTPSRLYAEYGKSKAAQEDFRIKRLNRNPDGYDKEVAEWLSQSNDSYIIHYTMRQRPTEASEKILQLLIKAYPDAVEQEWGSETPLLVACRRGYVDMMEILIDADANQAARDSDGRNILHLLLTDKPRVEFLETAFSLIDPDLMDDMFLQRSSLSSNGTAPIHAWITAACNSSAYGEQKRVVDTIELLLKYSKGRGLELLSGSGDTCLHTAIMSQQFQIARALINFNPSLLYRENAVGRTPFELAHDNLTAAQMSRPHSISRRAATTETVDGLVQNRKTTNRFKDSTMSVDEAKSKLREEGLSGDYDAQQVEAIMAAVGMLSHRYGGTGTLLSSQVIWDLCSTAMRKNPHPRRLVSLNEANDVARRLGERHTSDRYCAENPDVDEDNYDEE